MSVEDKQLQTRSTWRQHRFVSGWSCYKVPSHFFFLFFFFRSQWRETVHYCLSGMFLWLWIELTCILAPIFQYHFSLLESGYGSDVTWLNSNPIWLFFCCSSLGNQETSCTKLHMRWNHVQDPRGKPRVSFRIVLGSVGISARLFLL